MTERVTIFEVGPRDGLQNEPRMVPAADKITLVNKLSAAGLRRIEVTSFVSPKWVPQMADAAEVMAGIDRRTGVEYSALTPNTTGLTNAQTARADAVAVFASASEGFSNANINCTIAESLARFAPVLEAATVPVRGYISCVVECPYDGPTVPQTVADLAVRLINMGCSEISLGDTIGRATPEGVSAMLDAVLAVVSADKLAGHFHDTSGRALENIDVSLNKGLRIFDTAVGGLGGCPYAPGAAGNVATEAVVALLESEGFTTGIDGGKLADAARFARELRG